MSNDIIICVFDETTNKILREVSTLSEMIEVMLNYQRIQISARIKHNGTEIARIETNRIPQDGNIDCSMDNVLLFYSMDKLISSFGIRAGDIEFSRVLSYEDLEDGKLISVF